ncbi:MAG: hypothetical protein RIC16_03985 [Rhodospirillales bacterium]
MTKPDQAKAFRRALRDLELTQGQFRELLNRSATAIPGIAPVSADTISRYATGRYGVSAGVAAFIAALEAMRSSDTVQTRQRPKETTDVDSSNKQTGALVHRFAAAIEQTPANRLDRIERILRIMESEVTTRE